MTVWCSEPSVAGGQQWQLAWEPALLCIFSRLLGLRNLSLVPVYTVRFQELVRLLCVSWTAKLPLSLGSQRRNRDDTDTGYHQGPRLGRLTFTDRNSMATYVNYRMQRNLIIFCCFGSNTKLFLMKYLTRIFFMLGPERFIFWSSYPFINS